MARMTALERDLVAAWRADGNSPEQIKARLAARRERVARYVRPRNGEVLGDLFTLTVGERWRRPRRN